MQYLAHHGKPGSEMLQLRLHHCCCSAYILKRYIMWSEALPPQTGQLQQESRSNLKHLFYGPFLFLEVVTSFLSLKQRRQDLQSLLDQAIKISTKNDGDVLPTLLLLFLSCSRGHGKLSCTVRSLIYQAHRCVPWLAGAPYGLIERDILQYFHSGLRLCPSPRKRVQKRKNKGYSQAHSSMRIPLNSVGVTFE